MPNVRFWLKSVLGAFVILLLIANATKYGLLSWTWLASHKDALAAANSAVGIVAILVGGILAYYRFFRGRTFATRAELSIDVDVLEGPNERLLHVITVRVKNVGTVTIWDPNPVIDCVKYRKDASEDRFTIDQWFEPAAASAKTIEVGLLDSGESGDFFAQRLYDADVWAVLYAVTVRCASGDSWTKLKTVANRIPKSKSS